MSKRNRRRPPRSKEVRKKGKNARQKHYTPLGFQPTLKGEIIALLALVPFFLFGAALIYVGIHEISSTSTYTAETTGKVISVMSTHTLKNGEHTRKSRNKVTYSYMLNGTKCTDYFVTAQGVRADKELIIRYDPDDPKQKYVKGYDDSGDVLIVIVGIVWDGFMLLIAWFIVSICRNERARIRQKGGS